MPMTARAIMCAAAMFWLMCSTATAGTVSVSSWHPYKDEKTLVRTGMSKAEVEAKAGAPDRSDVIPVADEDVPTVSVWSYVRKGEKPEVTNLSFRGSELVKIEVTSLQ